MINQPVRTSLSDFIMSHTGAQFVIPVYQRVFTWNPEKETARYMDDIENLLQNQSDHHFLGIIIYTESDISEMFKQLQIVDGQQRLTTTFIFLLALKTVAREMKNENVSGMIDDQYIYNRHTSDQGSLRLKPAVSNDDVFARLVYGTVQDLSLKEKESGVYKNFDYIYRRLRDLARRYPLIRILQTLTKMDILAFPLSEMDNAQQIFESINSTGAPLTSADLIRNYVLMNHSNDAQERYYRMYWQPLEEYYPTSARLEDFFRYYLAVKTCTLLNRKDIYEKFKVFWNNDSRSAEEKLQEINRYARYCWNIYQGPCEYEEIEETLADFRRSGYTMAAPLLMEMYKWYVSEEISAAQMNLIIRQVDSYFTRRALCGNDNAAAAVYFPSLLRTVRQTVKDNHMDVVRAVRENLVFANKGKYLAMPTDVQLKTRLREINAYSLNCLRNVLERIEHNGASARVNISDLNIEHIMPQHPNDYWKKVSGTVDEDEYTTVVNLIGNLTLCAFDDNTKMGNEDFAYKKKVLSKTLHIRMNTEILKKKSWDKKAILKRCDELSDQLISIYPYAVGTAENTSLPAKKQGDIYTLNSPSVHAEAIVHAVNDVEVLAGSTMKSYTGKEMKKMRSLAEKMKEQGILEDISKDQCRFIRSYYFADLNSAAQFLMHRGGDNINAWVKNETAEKTVAKKKKSSNTKTSVKKAKVKSRKS